MRSLIGLVVVTATLPGNLAAGEPSPKGAAINDLSANRWTVVEDSQDGGCAGGLVYLPEQKGVLLFAARQQKSAHYWVELFRTADGKWEEWLPQAGRAMAGLGRGSCYTQWVKDKSTGYEMPALPHYNAGCWESHQRCYLPEEKKVLCFQGGVTFKYDPANRTFANMGLALGKSPPDVMLGSMAWNPVNKEAVLFGGGYLQAYQARPGDVKQERAADAWMPAAWDRRGTWAYNPAKNQWRKMETASQEVSGAHARLSECAKELRTLWGAARGVAFQYGDRVLGKQAVELAGQLDRFAASLATIAKDFAAQGGNECEKRQFANARSVLNGEVTSQLAEARNAMKTGDGWKALRALEAADWKLAEAGESLACAPPPRHYARLVCDPENKVLVLFGGDGEDRFLADTWLLHLDTHRWERCQTAAHPPHVGSGMVAMDYDAKNKAVVLAHPSGAVWTLDGVTRQWRELDIENTAAVKGSYFQSLEYDPAAEAHVMVVMPVNYYGAPRRTLLLRLDRAAKATEPAPSGPEEVWRPAYGGGGGGPADRYALAWTHLPKTQAEYRDRVTAHAAMLRSISPNTWTELKAPYSGWGRAYGSFCYDWDRDEIHLWGGGHSAYMGNEWSQYDLKSNLWMDSWNPEFPAHPFGCPDGAGWSPSFRHEVGSAHGYHNYAYSNGLKKTLLWGTMPYDPDRMRYAPKGSRLKRRTPARAWASAWR